MSLLQIGNSLLDVANDHFDTVLLIINYSNQSMLNFELNLQLLLIVYMSLLCFQTYVFLFSFYNSNKS